MTEAFNLNPVGGSPARHHGALVYGLADGRLEVDPDWSFWVFSHWPQRVVLNNSGQSAAYPSSNQVADRVIELRVWGWAGIPLQLRVIDPPDLAAYAPDGGWGTPVPPYEANDNRGTTDYGLATSPNATTWATTLKATPDASNDTLVAYLKVPERYSGDNFQVEVTKCDPTGTVLPQRVAGLSAVYTSWKRVFIERDKMFRKGGLLYADFDPQTCSPNCTRIEVYDWQNAAVGDTIVVFDETNTAEAGGEARAITNITDLSAGPCVPGTSVLCLITLDASLAKRYVASPNDGQTPPLPTFCDAIHGCHSAGFGVRSGCDSSPNQLNTANSCFFDADMRDMELPYGDAFVEIVGLRGGTGAVPYTGLNVLSAADLTVPARFSKIWFSNFIPLISNELYDVAHNYFHVIGIGNNTDSASGWSDADSDYAFISTGWIDAIYGSFPEYVRQATVHETGHLFRVNPCDGGHHDGNFAWCGQSHPLTCFSSPPGYEKCVMYENKDDPAWYALIANDINRFCCANLLGPQAGAICGNAPCASEDGIRNHVDPE